jgi:hypothetical protein
LVVGQLEHCKMGTSEIHEKTLKASVNK